MQMYFFLKNKSAICDASSVLWHGIKYAILENLSTTTYMLLLPHIVLGSQSTKSIDMSIQGDCGTGNGVYNLCGSP